MSQELAEGRDSWLRMSKQDKAESKLQNTRANRGGTDCAVGAWQAGCSSPRPNSLPQERPQVPSRTQAGSTRSVLLIRPASLNQAGLLTILLSSFCVLVTLSLFLSPPVPFLLLRPPQSNMQPGHHKFPRRGSS